MNKKGLIVLCLFVFLMIAATGKVEVCHKEHGKPHHTLYISISAQKAHLDHGDTLGACPEPIEGKYTVFIPIMFSSAEACDPGSFWLWPWCGEGDK